MITQSTHGKKSFQKFYVEKEFFKTDSVEK